MLVGAFVVLLAVAVPSALAIHDFTDVPDSNPFHGDIAAVKRAGITAGKNCVPPGTPPTYCPGENITREAMAAFVHRGFGRVAQDGGDNADISASVDTVIGSISIDVGGVPGQTQFVKLDAAYTLINDGAGCPCGYFLRIERANGSAFGWGNWDEVRAASVETGDSVSSGALTFVDVAPSGTTQTYEVVVTPAPGGESVYGWANMAAMTAPFGSTGTNVLGGEPPSGNRAGKSSAGPKR